MNSSKPAKKPVPFWVWSNWHKIASRDEELRTVIELRMDIAQVRRVTSLQHKHGPIDRTDCPPLIAELEYTVLPPDDCPWSVTRMFVVSDRVRKILESAAPGECQFVPIDLSHDGRRCDLTYWMLYVDSIDCADKGKSGRTGNGVICDPVIIEERVPESTQIFREWDPSRDFSGATIFVRDALRRVLVREKVTGCFFYEPPIPSPRLPRAGRSPTS